MASACEELNFKNLPNFNLNKLATWLVAVVLDNIG